MYISKNLNNKKRLTSFSYVIVSQILTYPLQKTALYYNYNIIL